MSNLEFSFFSFFFIKISIINRLFHTNEVLSAALLNSSGPSDFYKIAVVRCNRITIRIEIEQRGNKKINISRSRSIRRLRVNTTRINYVCR